MASLDWDRYLQLALAAFAVAVAAFIGSSRFLPPGGQMNWQAQALQVISATVLCAAIFLFVQAGIHHPGWLRWRAAKEKARTAARGLVEREAEQARLRPILAAWGRFLAAAGEVWRLFQELSGHGESPKPITDSEWNIWRDAIIKAWRLSDDLEANPRTEARRQLDILAAAPRDNMDAEFIPAYKFNDWLTDQNIEYLAKRTRAGLPSV